MTFLKYEGIGQRFGDNGGSIPGQRRARFARAEVPPDRASHFDQIVILYIVLWFNVN